MNPSLTQPAFDRLAQLAENAFEEEQCECSRKWHLAVFFPLIRFSWTDDLGVASMSQMAVLGWHPTR